MLRSGKQSEDPNADDTQDAGLRNKSWVIQKNKTKQNKTKQKKQEILFFYKTYSLRKDKVATRSFNKVQTKASTNQ